MIGQYPITTLAKAREGALEALRDFERGIIADVRQEFPGPPGAKPDPLPGDPQRAWQTRAHRTYFRVRAVRPWHEGTYGH